MIVFHYSKKDKTLELPENFEEMSELQIKKIEELKLSKDDNAVIRLKVLRTMLSIPEIKFFMLPSEVKSKMLPYTEWVFK